MTSCVRAMKLNGALSRRIPSGAQRFAPRQRRGSGLGRGRALGHATVSRAPSPPVSPVGTDPEGLARLPARVEPGRVALGEGRRDVP